MNNEEPSTYHSNAQHLRQLIIRYFNIEELKTLLFDIAVDYEELRGESKSDKVRELITFLQRRDRLDELLAKLAVERPGIQWPGNTSPDIPCPYRGLFPFYEMDAPNFYGREEFTEQLFSLVNQKPLVAVVGSSGSGKSSVVFAGLVPKFKQTGNWLIASFRPGSRPFTALAAALLPYIEPDLTNSERLPIIPELANNLRLGQVSLTDIQEIILQQHNPNTRILLIADQFEELYTLTSDIEIRQQFLDLLLDTFDTNFTPANSQHLVLALRADFMEHVLKYPPMVAALQNNDLKLGPMTSDAMLKAIQEPARRAGVYFETKLVERILNDVGKEENSLPLLEFTLTLLWEWQTGNRKLTHVAYEQIGQVKGALVRHAEQIYAGLNDVEKERVERIFLQLVRPGEGTEDTRRLALRSELVADDWAIVQRLTNDRLLVTDRDEFDQETVEMIHEALVQCWIRLQEWMAKNRDFRKLQEYVRNAMHYWQKNERDEGALLSELTAVDASYWMERRPEEISQDEKNFIEASLEKRERLGRQRNIEAELKATQDLATLGTALGAIQHRINNTLNIVSPNIERLRKRVDAEDEDTVEILDIIDRNVHYTAQIIYRIQEALRGERQRMNLNRILLDVAKQTLTQWQAVIKDDEIVISTELDENLDNIVFDWPIGQITEVFTNLANNACRAMPEGGRLDIVSKLDGNLIKVRVIDTGSGIPDSILPRLFTRPVPTKKTGGTSGLGLYLGSLIVQSLRGSIEIEATGPQGTTVLVIIPLP
ncbi:MAG: HAMP domain-containing histidine kinase [Anaerolineae bacterium]|nr:HAMP domain-containing histidine kinase [Anaerolineae bacterium]